MKRKVYATKRERMIDQIMGFLAFPLVNILLAIILWIITQKIESALPIFFLILPWIVNGLVLALAFLLRPEFGSGYIAFIGVAVGVVTLLSALFVAACFVTFLTILSFPDIGDHAGLVFIILMAASLVVLGGVAIYVFQRWWLSYKNNSQ